MNPRIVFSGAIDTTFNDPIAHSSGFRPSPTPWHHQSPLFPGDSEKRGRFTAYRG